MKDGTTRNLLVKAGVELLEETGSADIGLRSIARRAGVSHGAPRRWFPTHRALLAAIAEVGLRELGAAMAPSAESTDPPLEQLAKSYVAFAARRPAMFTLIFRHDLLAGSGSDLRSISRPMFDRLVTMIPLTAGDEDAEIAAATLWVGIHGIATLSASGALGAATSDLRVDELIRRVISGAITQ